MVDHLIVHTTVNEVVDGAIRNVTLTVLKAESQVLSATVKIDETGTKAKLAKAIVNSHDETCVKKAMDQIVMELSRKGIEKILFDSLE